MQSSPVEPRVRRAVLAGCCALVFSACTPDPSDVPEQEAPPPVPGFVVSIPVVVRALVDVTVVDADAKGITAAWAVGSNGTVLGYDGRQWRAETSGVTVDLEGVSGIIDPDGDPYVVAVGADGTMIERVGSGEWRAVPTNVTQRLFGVWVRARDDVFAVGDRGRVLRFDGETAAALVDEVLIDTGALDENDVPIAFPISDPLKSVMGRDNEVFAVGPRGSVYRLGLDGGRFAREESLTSRPLSAVFTRAGVWAATTDGVLLRRREGVWNDTQYNTPVPAFLQGVWARNDNDVFAVGLTPEIFHFIDGVWSSTAVGERVELRAVDGIELPLASSDAPDAVRKREVFAVGAGGRIVRGPLALPRADETSLTTTLTTEQP